MASYSGRLTTVRLCSTATRRGSIRRCASNVVMLTGPSISSGSPLTRIVKVYLKGAGMPKGPSSVCSNAVPSFVRCAGSGHSGARRSIARAMSACSPPACTRWRARASNTSVPRGRASRAAPRRWRAGVAPDERVIFVEDIHCDTDRFFLPAGTVAVVTWAPSTSHGPRARVE